MRIRTNYLFEAGKKKDFDTNSPIRVLSDDVTDSTSINDSSEVNNLDTSDKAKEAEKNNTFNIVNAYKNYERRIKASKTTAEKARALGYFKRSIRRFFENGTICDSKEGLSTIIKSLKEHNGSETRWLKSMQKIPEQTKIDFKNFATYYKMCADLTVKNNTDLLLDGKNCIYLDSFWNRSPSDFKYTVKILSIVTSNDLALLKKFFSSGSIVNGRGLTVENQKLFFDGRGNLKPAGIKNYSTQRNGVGANIYTVIEQLSKTSVPNVEQKNKDGFRYPKSQSQKKEYEYLMRDAANKTDDKQIKELIRHNNKLDYLSDDV